MDNENPLTPGTTASGSIICEQIGLAFPKLWRGEANATASDLAQHDFGGEHFEPGEWIAYELAPEEYRTVGTVNWSEPHFLDADHDTSYVIRHHKTLEHAEGYAAGVADLQMGGEEDWDRVIHKTTNGIFTKVRVPTRENWPGPLLIYSAQVPHPLGHTYWFKIIGPEGEVTDGERLGISWRAWLQVRFTMRRRFARMACASMRSISRIKASLNWP